MTDADSIETVLSQSTDARREDVRAWLKPSELVGLIGVGLLFLLSVAIRLPEAFGTTGMRNLEAPYHVLLTVTALSESSFQEHWGLPTVSLGMDRDELPWGATVSSSSGHYIYTSFAPFGFLLPYLFFLLTPLQPSLAGLFVLNILVEGVVVLLLWFLVRNIARSLAGAWRLNLAAGAAVLLYVFSREALASHGLIYWHQSVYQIFLLTQLLLVHRLLSKAGSVGLGLAVVSFFAASFEWTGYVFNAFLVAFLLYEGRRRRGAGATRQAVLVACATAAAGFVFLAHYSVALGLSSTAAAMTGRFLARSGAQAGLAELLPTYSLSFPLVGTFVLGLMVLVMAQGRRPELERASWAVVGLSALPSLENLLLVQHATEFTYDRLKVIVPLALLVGLGFAALTWRALAPAGALLLVVAAVNVHTHRQDLLVYEGWAGIHDRNLALRDEVASLVDLDCAELSTNVTVRGYANLLFGRGIREAQPAPVAPSASACGSVYLTAEVAFTDLPRYVSANVVRQDGTTELVAPPV